MVNRAYMLAFKNSPVSNINGSVCSRKQFVGGVKGVATVVLNLLLVIIILGPHRHRNLLKAKKIMLNDRKNQFCYFYNQKRVANKNMRFLFARFFGSFSVCFLNF